MFKTLSAFGILSLLAPFSFANDAGCGLGSLIITKNAKLSQSLALTTNATFSSQLFGITSGTSNCSASGLVQNNPAAIHYAEANFQNLQVEMARGEGENLAAFAQLMGCSDPGISVFGAHMRARYAAVFPADSTTPEQLVKTVSQELSQSHPLSELCHLAI